MSDPKPPEKKPPYNYPPDKPLFARPVYDKWLALDLGSAEQQERYRAAIRWYEEHREAEMKG